MRRWWLLAGLVLLPWGMRAAGDAGKKPGPNAEAMLLALNQRSRAIYQKAREEALARGGPVVRVGPGGCWRPHAI